MSDQNYAGDISPTDTYAALRDNPDAALVDVRTTAEWQFVGQPDLSSLNKQPVNIEWQIYPSMDVNAGFANAIKAAGLSPEQPIYFLCRSGVRSKAAAAAMTAAGYTACYNIDNGFEGAPDANKHRGTVNGWQADGLPWVQS